MAKGQEIDKLYISLGLDINDLKLGFDTTGKTVNQAVSRLNAEAKKIKLQTDVDLAKLQGAGNEMARIKAQAAGINKELETQRKLEAIMAAQLKGTSQKYGADHYLTQRSEMALLKQQKVIAGLEAQLRGLGKTFDTIPAKSTGAFSAISKGAGMARSGIGKLSEGYGLLNAKMAAVMAIAATGGGLFEITKGAMEAGNNLYKLQQRLNVSTAEAGQLNRAFNLAGTSINTLAPFIAKIDKQLLTAGEAGNNTSKALQRFGITLTDESGQLLQINEQLEQLAKGYRAASEAGEVEAFTAEILGAKGAALIPVLEEYSDLMAISKNVKTTGLLNPAEAHETYLEWQKMSMELGQLKTAFGAALLPVSKELMPMITDGLVAMVELIAENKDNIKVFGEVLVDALQTAGAAMDTVASGLEAIGINAQNAGDILRDIKAEFDAGYGGALLASVGNPVTAVAAISGLSHSSDVQDQRAFNDDKEKSRKAEAAYWADIEKRSKQRQQEARKEQQAAAAAQQQAEAVAKATAEMHEALYSVNHTDLETQLHSIDKAMEKYKEAGVSEVEIEKATQEQKAKIIKQFNDDVARQIDSVWKSAYQNRLDEIQREKEAWIQKGLDEVEATKWAEEQKRQLQQDTALSMFKENYKYLKLYRKAMAGYGTDEEKQANAMNAVLQQMRKDAKLPADAWTTPQEIAGFSQLMKQAKENIVPIYDSMPNKWVMKGTDVVPMFAPDYNDAAMSKLGNTPAPIPASATQEDINYNLYVRVDGLEDVSNEVAQSAAKQILDRLPSNANVNISYGG